MTDAASPDPDAHDVDAIAAALARLRGRPKGPGGPGWPGWHGGDAGHGGPRRHHGRHGMTGAPGPEGAEPAASGPGMFGPGGFGPGAFGPGGRIAGLARMRMLDALAGASHPLSVSELGETIGVDQPRASRLIQQGVELGLVRREADPDDARRTRVALTDEGARLVHGFRGQRREQVSRALQDFSEVERAELARLLTKLAAAWTPSA